MGKQRINGAAITSGHILDACFDNYKFHNCAFVRTIFDNCSLRICDFNDVNFIGCVFVRCDFSASLFRSVTFTPYDGTISVNGKLVTALHECSFNSATLHDFDASKVASKHSTFLEIKGDSYKLPFQIIDGAYYE